MEQFPWLVVIVVGVIVIWIISQKFAAPRQQRRRGVDSAGDSDDFYTPSYAMDSFSGDGAQPGEHSVSLSSSDFSTPDVDAGCDSAGPGSDSGACDSSSSDSNG